MRSELSKFVRWFEGTRKDPLDGIARAAIAYLWFETIHPFEDGNGRVGRAIIDLALARDAAMDARLYSMSRRLKKNRDGYYIELARAQRGGLDVTPWVFWFIGQFGDACAASEMVIDLSLDRVRFRTRHREISLNQRQRKAVNLLLEAGPDSFEGGLNTRKYVSLMKTSRATAFRELDALAGAGLLVQVGQGRATWYFVKIDGWYADGEKGKGDGCSLSTVTGGEGDPFSHFPFHSRLTPPHRTET